jgi:hypothetical protein
LPAADCRPADPPALLVDVPEPFDEQATPRTASAMAAVCMRCFGFKAASVAAGVELRMNDLALPSSTLDARILEK